MEMRAPLTARRSMSDMYVDSPYRTHPKKSPKRHLLKDAVEKQLGPRFTGWRFGVLNFALWASVVFLINLVGTIWGAAATTGERGVLFEGDCDRVKQLSTGLHLLINILSTILLAGR
jgi:hypothetical protein